MSQLLTTDKTQITLNHKLIMLKGVNCGGWLMKEAYILHAPNDPEQKFRAAFVKQWGLEEFNAFEHKFQNSFVREEDFQRISQLGFILVLNGNF